MSECPVRVKFMSERKGVYMSATNRTIKAMMLSLALVSALLLAACGSPAAPAAELPLLLGKVTSLALKVLIHEALRP